MTELLEAALRLTLTPGLGRIRVRKLLERFETPAAAMTGVEAEWQEVLEETDKAAELLRLTRSKEVRNRVAGVQRRCHELGISMLPLGAGTYPAHLTTIPDPPPVLYCVGKPPTDGASERRVAIVGTRKATSQGLAFTHRVARELARAGAVIVSGLALGIDSEAHRSMLEQSGTGIAVLANGLETVHPNSHLRLAREIVATGGCLLSENPPGTRVQPWHFISRNRIISGLARTVLIVEAGLQSGAMRTAQFALEQGRTVMVMPGRPSDPSVAGCLQLLSDGAGPATSAEDVLATLRLDAMPGVERTLEELGEAATLLHGAAASFESLLTASGYTPARLLTILGRLELEGRVGRTADGNYFQTG